MDLFIKLKNKYGELNTHDLWKFGAIVLMIVDHFGLYVFDNQYLRVIGRAAFPIFAVVYGYSFRGKLKFSLLLWGLPVILVNYFINYDFFSLNILYSFFFGSVVMKIYNKFTKKELDNFFFMLILFFLHYIIRNFIEYGSFIILFMLIAQSDKKFKLINFILIFSFYFIEESILFSFSFIQIILFMLILSTTSFLLYNYEIKIIKINNQFVNNLIKIIARFSMEFYAIQSCLFEIFSYLKNL